MRDDFNAEVKRNVANRVNSFCSNPSCRAATSGPNSDITKAVNIGVAAHITAASEGGPRYASEMLPSERSHASNAIWLCQNCAKLIDNDPSYYTVAKLNSWKAAAETEAQSYLGKTTQTIGSGANNTRSLPKFTLCTLSPTAAAGNTSVTLDVNVFRSKAFDQSSYMFAALIPFENRAVSSEDCDVEDIWAEIIFRESNSGMEMSRIASACWIDHPLAEIDFPLNTPHYLFVGGWEIVDKNFTSDIQLFEFSRSLNRPIEKKPSFQGYPHDLILDVTLTPNGYHEAAQRFQFSFRMMSRGTYSIRPLVGRTA